MLSADAVTCEQSTRLIAELKTEIAARKNGIAEMADNLQRYLSLIDNANDLIHSVTPDGGFLYVNQAWINTLGYSMEEVQKMSLMDIVAKDSKDKCQTMFTDLLHGKAIDRNEVIFIAKDGEKIHVEGRCQTQFKNGIAIAMNGIFRDITKRLEDEQALLESEIRFRDLFENASDLIQMVRPDGKFLYVNRAWKETFGYTDEEVQQLTIFNIIDPNCQDHCSETFQRIISEEMVTSIETTFSTKEGREVYIEGNALCKFENGKPVSTQCIFRDVTDKKKMEEELFKAQKLESIGILAGGLAHDFNNLLTGILGNISLAKLNFPPEDATLKLLEESEKASLRAMELTRQLLTFSKGGAPVKRTTSIIDLIKETSAFSIRGSKATCVYDLAEDLWSLEVDEGQLGQVIQNLIINAAQAMPNSGTITLTARNASISSNDRLPLPAGRYVRIAVRDHGIGISKENISNIFDPYFSDKETGSGLGLTIAYSVVKKHDGLITVDSEPNVGTTFTIYLPATDKPLPPLSNIVEERTGSIGGAKVLVLDDEKLIRDVTCEILHQIGCEAEAVSDGLEAIALYRKAKDEGVPFDVLIIDLTIPGGMGGLEAITRLKEIDPEIKAIVSSGYADDPIMANYQDYGFCGVVPKPYMISELNKALSIALHPGKGPPS